MTRAPQAVVAQSRPIGRWNVYVKGMRNGGYSTQDITWLRGSPITIDNLSWTDPFGPETASLSFPQVSALERTGLGSSELWWLRSGTEVDIVFTITNTEAVQLLNAIGKPTKLIWEGRLLAPGFSSTSDGSMATCECAGAMRALDGRIAPKITFSRPYPYEWIIWRHFDYANAQHPTGLAPMRKEWPAWWANTYRYNADLPWYLQPAGIDDGDMWSGMLVREFGRWDAVLTSAIQGLLSVMFTERGQFTLQLDQGRSPVLRHRERLNRPGPLTLEVDAAWPGVTFTLNSDASQKVDAIYGEARSAISGTAFRGTRYTIDGAQAGFDPFAIHHRVDPSSPMRDPSATRNELFISFSDGMAPADAIEKSRRHIATNSTPGWTGTISLASVDPRLRHPQGEMVPFPALMVRAGDTILFKGFQGRAEGTMFNVARAQINIAESSVQLQVDTKFRDYMTVREVIDRGRDALRPWHLMTVGSYDFNVPDAMLPWDYAQGSGYIPYRANVRDFWAGMPVDMSFPWLALTTQRQPRNSLWGQYYIKVPAIVRDEQGNSSAVNNWNRPSALSNSGGYEVLLSQAGEIALLQICAYDEYGLPKKVPFHVSVWQSNHAAAEITPVMRAETPGVVNGVYTSWFTDADGVTKSVKYPINTGVAQPYPFFKDAWENIRSDGSQNNDLGAVPPDTASLLVGYGNSWEKAGYWPHTGRSETDDFTFPSAPGTQIAAPTGMLVDEQGWSFDMSKFNAFDPTSKSNTLLEHANATVLIFCESETDTYFLGRLFRKEYGAS